MSDTSRVQLYGLQEASWGVTPASAMTAVRFTGESMNYEKSSITSNEIRSDRQTTDTTLVDFNAKGGFNFEMSYAEYDAYLMGVLFSAGWSTAIAVSATDISASSVDNSFNSTTTDFTTENISVGQWIKVGGFTAGADNGFFFVESVAASKLVVSGGTLVTETAGNTITMAGSMIRNGTTMTSWSFEKAFTDITQFISFTGMIPNKLDLNISAQEILTGVFDFLGKASAIAQVTIGTGAPNDSTSNAVLNAGTNVASIREGGAEITSAYVHDMSISIDNKLRGRKAIGIIGNSSVGASTLAVTGSINAYFEDELLYEKLITDAETSYDTRFTDAAGNTLIITMPRVKFSSGSANAPQKDDDVMVNLGFEALRHATYGYMIQIDRFAV